MRAADTPRSKRKRRAKADLGRPSIGIRELKAKASAIVEDVKRRRVTYAVTKHGVVEALIVPVDAGERLLVQPNQDSAWEAWQALVTQLANESGKKTRSAVAELERMRR
jgi:antitoxin (DNA-binding transcriptional repressor) of toxin-antitoxin stability system